MAVTFVVYGDTSDLTRYMTGLVRAGTTVTTHQGGRGFNVTVADQAAANLAVGQLSAQVHTQHHEK